MRHSTLRQLEVFSAIARLGSFTRAAEAMFLTQPTVSMQIKKLTDAVGVPLFEQVGKKIQLTDAGRELQRACHEVFASLGRFEMYVADLKGLATGNLHIAVVTTAKYFIPRLLGSFCQLHPGIDASLKVTNRERILGRMARNEDDLYILGQPPDDLELTAEPFLPNPLVVLAPAAHPLKAVTRIPLASLADEPFLFREPGSGTRIATERHFAEHGVKIRVRMELGSNEAIKQAVIGGLGLAVLSEHTLAMDAPAGQIAVLDVEGFPIQRHWYVVYPAGKQLSVVARAFLEHLRRAQQGPVGEGLRPERSRAE
jgi:DNA-binding transcriptional LysR family regulator